MLRHRDRGAHAPGLEALGRVERLVLDKKSGETVLRTESRRGQERREALTEGDDVGVPPHRQDLAVAPERLHPGRQCGLGQRARGGGQVVLRGERFATGPADVLREGGVMLLATGGARAVGGEGGTTRAPGPATEKPLPLPAHAAPAAR